jgi:putative two-component system response regulator
MKTHTTIGADILANSNAEVLSAAQAIALYHHEKWDGTGYPHGLSRTAIPIESRIVALADTFDALISVRPYKPAFSIEHAYEIIMLERGKHFDPDIVDIFLNNVDRFEKIKREVESAQTGDFL